MEKLGSNNYEMSSSISGRYVSIIYIDSTNISERFENQKLSVLEARVLPITRCFYLH